MESGETFLGFLSAGSTENEVVKCYGCRNVFVVQLVDTDKLRCCPFCRKLWVARTNPELDEAPIRQSDNLS